ncbi:MAG TPA: MOSC domain-containing protein [Tepidisphaeraceae bacterium]|nr:MOSC domain-containing protein [Tepidisphaeraceae bacterium]
MKPVLAQINTSRGGIPKTPVLFAQVTRDGVAGDWQRNRRYHGGTDRAVCLYSEELYAELRSEGIDLVNGAVGENFTTRGLNLQHLASGQRLRVGAHCVIEITDVRVPCRTLAKCDPNLPALMQGRSGWVARVISEGAVRARDPIQLLPRKSTGRGKKQKPIAA